MIRAVLLSLLLLSSAAPRGLAAGPDEDGSTPWVQRLGRVAELYHDTALGFACEETLSWSSKRLGSGRHKFGYVYAYDESRGIDDYRTWVRVREGNAARRVSPEAHGIPYYLRRAYSWIFLFRESRWPLHRYELVGKETVLGRPALKIGFEPIPPFDVRLNGWFGWAWVDRETAQPLRFEAYKPEDWETKLELERVLAGEAPDLRGTYEVETVVTEFTVVKNGMRFPGTVAIDRVQSRVKSARKGRVSAKTVYEVRQVYDDYGFYGVRTAAEIQGFVDGLR